MEPMQPLDPMELLDRVLCRGTLAHTLVVDHGRRVADLALVLAARIPDREPDLVLVEQGALLHDIGVGATHVPALGCHGSLPYVVHGLVGRRLLERYGLPQHAMICERHVGAGLSAEEIRDQDLPLPPRDMLPLTVEQRLVCYADKFHSKGATAPRTVDQALASLARHGPAQVRRMQAMVDEFGVPWERSGLPESS
jgi:uncharacterized protein